MIKVKVQQNQINIKKRREIQYLRALIPKLNKDMN